MSNERYQSDCKSMRIGLDGLVRCETESTAYRPRLSSFNEFKFRSPKMFQAGDIRTAHSTA